MSYTRVHDFTGDTRLAASDVRTEIEAIRDALIDLNNADFADGIFDHSNLAQPTALGSVGGIFNGNGFTAETTAGTGTISTAAVDDMEDRIFTIRPCATIVVQRDAVLRGLTLRWEWNRKALDTAGDLIYFAGLEMDLLANTRASDDDSDYGSVLTGGVDIFTEVKNANSGFTIADSSGLSNTERRWALRPDTVPATVLTALPAGTLLRLVAKYRQVPASAADTFALTFQHFMGVPHLSALHATATSTP